MGRGDVRLLKTIGGVDFTEQERADLNKLTMPSLAFNSASPQRSTEHQALDPYAAGFVSQRLEVPIRIVTNHQESIASDHFLGRQASLYRFWTLRRALLHES